MDRPAEPNDVEAPRPSAIDLPVIDMIDPNNGRPGDEFTIIGSHLILDTGDAVEVRFQLPTDPTAPPDPGPFVLVGDPTATTIVAVVPDMPREEKFPVLVARSDGAEALSPESFQITLL